MPVCAIAFASDGSKIASNPIACSRPALFIRYHLTITPQIPAAQREAANALGEDRFERYKGHLKTILSHTSRHLFGMMDDVYMDENSFFTEAELEALSRMATEEAIRKEQQKASEGGI